MRKKIGELLVESGAVTEAKVRNALGHQKAHAHGDRLGRILVSMGLVSPAAVARALATQFDLPFIELPEVPPEVIATIPIDFQAEHRVVPFRLEAEGRSEKLHVAVEDPGDLTVVDELRFQLRKTIRVYVAAADDIDNAISLARGEKLDVVEAIALEEDSGSGEMSIERDRPEMVAGGRFDPQAPMAPPVPGSMASLEWELPAETPKKSAPPPPPPRAAPPTLTPPPPPPPARAAPPPMPPPPPPPQGASAQASVDFLDALLGTAPKAPPPPPPEPTTPRVPVVVFGGAAQGVTPPPPPIPPEFSEADLQVLDSIEKLADGQEATLDSEKVKPARMVAALIRLLIKKGVIKELEFLEELARK